MWLAVTFVNVYVPDATAAGIRYAVDQHVGDVVAVVRRDRVGLVLPPIATVCVPFGVTLPPAPALAVMVAWLCVNVALMVWFAWTLVNV